LTSPIWHSASRRTFGRFGGSIDRIVARKSVRFNSIQWFALILENLGIEGVKRQLTLERAVTDPQPSVSLRE
jgi:hypothetical protein